VVMIETGLFLHQPFKGPVLAGSKVHSVASFLNLGMKKAADFFQNLRQGWITEKGAALCDNTLFLCDIWFLYRAPLSAALKNIDFTGFPHVFLWQRS
ncbi:MAG: hypothetical protein SOR56_04050, partial [Oscillospiraceae bacterium]|nr:hypothetical protein [Oscillospiraceae bacterium]